MLIQHLLWPNVLPKNVLPEPSLRLTELVLGMFVRRNRENRIQFFERQLFCLGDKEKDEPPSDYIPCRIPVECSGDGESVSK
jgi:hypothetical protein